MTDEPSITLTELQAILDRETSVIAPEDVWLLMDVAREVARTPATVADRVTDWDITATAELIASASRAGRLAHAWKVTLTREFFKITVTVLTAAYAGEPTAADGLREVRRAAITYGRIARALTGTGKSADADEYDRVMAWLGEQRFDALVYNTAD